MENEYAYLQNRNQPAFPIVVPDGDNKKDGLTKRELIAAMAMQGLFSNYKFMQDCTDAGKSHKDVVTASIKASDELLSQLNKTL